MKTGRLLDVLSGHEGPVHGLMFSPTNVSPPVFHLYIVCTPTKWQTDFLLSTLSC